MNQSGGEITVRLILDDKQFNAATAKADTAGTKLANDLDRKTRVAASKAAANFEKLGSSIAANLDTSASAIVRALGSDIYNAGQRVSDFGSKVVGVGNSVYSFGDRVGKAGTEVSNLGSSITKQALPAALAIGAAIGGVSKMAWSQVSAVEQATVAFNAYEKDATKVDSVLKNLLAYARSDAGVLFNRKDLFAAAQGLKVMGAETENLTSYVQIMSRSVGLGLSDWDTLGRVIGRVGSTGKLTGIDFDMLTKAGFKMDTSLRNQSISWEELFKHLDKGIPADAMAGQAETIVGLGVRVQTALRGIGETILGVDKDTGKFIEGGAGAQLKQFFADLPDIIKQPEVQAGFKQLGESVSQFVQQALPVLIKIFTFIGENSDVILKIVAGWLAFGTVMKLVGSIIGTLEVAIKLVGGVIKGVGIAIKVVGGIIKGFGLAIKGIGIAMKVLAANPIMLIILAVIALVAAVVYLQKRFNIFGKAFEALKPVLQAVGNFFASVWEKISSVFQTVVSAIAGFWNSVLKPVFDFIISVLGTVLSIFTKVFAFILLVVVGTLVIIASFIWGVMKGIWNIITTVWNAVWGVISSVVGWIWDKIVTAFNFWKDLITGVLNTIWDIISGVWNKIWGFLEPIINKIWDFIKGVFEKVSNFVKDVWDRIWRTVSTAVSNIWNGVKETFDKVVGFVGGIAGRVLGAIGNLGKTLYDKGKDLIQGLLDGAGSLLSKIGNFFLEKLPKPIQGAFKKALGISSPSKVFAEYGKNIVEGLSIGISKNAMQAIHSADQLASQVAGVQNGIGSGNIGFGLDGTSVGGSTAAPVQQTNNIYNQVDLVAINRELAWELRR